MQSRKQPHRFTHHIHLQVVSGVLLMLFGALYVVLPFSARSQEPTGTPVPPSATAPLEATPADAPTSTPAAAAAPEPPSPTAEEVAPTVAPPAAPPEEPTAAPPLPTAAPPLPTFAPVVPAAAPPLSLGIGASAERAGAGQDVRLTATLSSDSDAARTVRVEVELDPQLEATSAEASGGSCAVGVPVVCNVTVQGDTSATINVIGRVRAEAVVGSQLVSQAVARDDANNTAASDPVVVIVSDGLAIVPMSRTAIPVTPIIAESIASAPSPQPTSAAPTDAVADATAAPAPPQSTSVPVQTPRRGSSTPAPAPTNAPVQATPTPDDLAAALAPAPAQGGVLEQVAPTASPSAAPVQTPSAVPTALVAVATPLPTDAPVQATPADGIFAAPEGESTQLPTPAAPLLQTENLPNTDSNAPLLGWSSMLLGFALTAHGTRRVRREHTLLAARGRETRQLEPLVDAIAYLSGAVKDETEQMQRISEECIEMLRTDAHKGTKELRN